MSKSDDTSKDKENIVHSKKSKESDQDEANKIKESHELEHIRDNCKDMSFKPILNFCCHNCHGYGHHAIDCKKPKFDNDNGNSRMFRDTNLIGRRKRSHNNDSGERR